MEIKSFVEGLPKTECLYLKDSFLREFDGQVLKCTREGKKIYLALDKTAFQPQGGGQPTDIGKITSSSANIDVSKVMFVSGRVIHYAQRGTEPKEGDQVHGEIDWERRLNSMINHTGGHLIHSCLLKFNKELSAVKAMHARPCWIHYLGVIPSQETISETTELANRIVNEGRDVFSEFVTYEELVRRCSFVPTNLPKDKPLRIVIINGFEPLACGGTHVTTTQKIGSIQIPSVKPTGEKSFTLFYETRGNQEI